MYYLQTTYVENQITLMKDLKLVQGHFFIFDLNLLSCELEAFTFKCYIESFYTNITSNQNKFLISQFLLENLKCFL